MQIAEIVGWDLAKMYTYVMQIEKYASCQTS